MGFSLRAHMKSALLAAILGIAVGLASLLAVSAEDRTPVIKVQPPKSFPDYGEAVVPQIEETPPRDVLVPQPVDHYLAEAKIKKPALRRHVRVVRHRPNFFEKLFADFIKLQKHHEAKSFINGFAQLQGAAE